MDRHSFSPLGPEGAGQDYILRLIEEFGRFAGKRSPSFPEARSNPRESKSKPITGTCWDPKPG
jgi:hypothetical protein